MSHVESRAFRYQAQDKAINLTDISERKFLALLLLCLYYSRNANAKKLKPNHPPLLVALIAVLYIAEVVAGVETELEDDDEAVEALSVLDDTGVGTRPEELSMPEDVVTTLDGEDAVTGKLVSELEEVDSVVTEIEVAV